MRRFEGFTLIELMIVVAIIAIVAAIAIPSLQNARKSANEASAVQFLRTAVTVGQQYRLRFGTIPSSPQDMFDAGFIDDEQSPSGYALDYLAQGSSNWRLNADPEVPGQTGDRYFYVDQTGVIRFSSTGTATSTSTPIGAAESGGGSGNGGPATS